MEGYWILFLFLFLPVFAQPVNYVITLYFIMYVVCTEYCKIDHFIHIDVFPWDFDTMIHR